MSLFFRLPCLVLLAAVLLGGCAVKRPVQDARYDFGSLTTIPGAALPALPPVNVSEVRTADWLDHPRMLFRLRYREDHQPRVYADSRWIMPPGSMFERRLSMRITQAGGVVLAPSDGVARIPSLHIDLEDFIQDFDAPAQSTGRVVARATLMRGRTLVGQKTFAKEVPAPSADAVGGARALAAASDAVIVDMMHWLAPLLAQSN